MRSQKSADALGHEEQHHDQQGAEDDFFQARKIAQQFRQSCQQHGTDHGSGQAAQAGFLFRSPANVRADFPQFPAVDAYDDLAGLIAAALDRTPPR